MPRKSKPPPRKPKPKPPQTPQSQLEATRRLQQRIPGESPYQRYARISRGLMPKKSGGAIKLQRGGMSPEAPYRGPTRNPNPRPNRRGVPTGPRRPPPTHEQGLEMARGIADAFGLPGSRTAELRRRKQRADLPPGYQRGGELVDPTPFYPSRIPGGPAGWRPRRPNVPLPPGARRRRGRGRGGRDV